jgi:hypothetical protein
MRVLIDTNVYISFLLTHNLNSAVHSTIAVMLQAGYELLLPQELIVELSERVENKPYLAGRISKSELRRLLGMLNTTAIVLPTLDRVAPRIGRDPKDDYLLFHALLAEADVLITGDRDLLVLDPLGSLRILTPQAFLTLIEA